MVERVTPSEAFRRRMLSNDAGVTATRISRAIRITANFDTYASEFML